MILNVLIFIILGSLVWGKFKDEIGLLGEMLLEDTLKVDIHDIKVNS